MTKKVARNKMSLFEGKNITQADVDQAGKDITQIRTTLEAEARMLVEGYDARLVSYACLTTAIRCAIEAGMTPDHFAQVAAQTIGAYCGDRDAVAVIVIDPSDE